MLSKMELEGMKHGCFPMDKEECVAACRKYRQAIENEGKSTRLEWLAGDLFIVIVLNNE